MALNKNIKIVLLSMVHSLIVIVLCYAAWNIPYAFDDEAVVIKQFNSVRRYLGELKRVDLNLLMVNTAYDRVLVPIVDEYGIPKGNIDITDRKKLLRLLQVAYEGDNYRYLFLDIYLDPAYQTEVDSELFHLIATMPRIVIPCHQDEAGVDKIVRQKSALSDYATSLTEDNFLKYKFLHDDNQRSLPLYAYSELTGKSIRNFFGVYLCGGSLCTNSIVLDFPVQITGEYTAEGEKVIYQLGSDLIDTVSGADLSGMIQGRDILIGDFTENDIHDTVVGPTSGPLISYNAFLALMNNQHLISWGIMGMLFLILWGASYISFTDIQFINYLPRWKILGSELFRFMLTWIGFTSILTVVCFGIYLTTGKMLDILVISTYFSLLDTVIESYRLIKKKDRI